MGGHRTPDTRWFVQKAGKLTVGWRLSRARPAGSVFSHRATVLHARLGAPCAYPLPSADRSSQSCSPWALVHQNVPKSSAVNLKIRGGCFWRTISPLWLGLEWDGGPHSLSCRVLGPWAYFSWRSSPGRCIDRVRRALNRHVREPPACSRVPRAERFTHPRRPRGDFKSKAKPKHKPDCLQMTTAHGCASNEHHRQRNGVCQLTAQESRAWHKMPLGVVSGSRCPRRKTAHHEPQESRRGRLATGHRHPPKFPCFLEFLFLVSFEEFCPRTKFEFHYIEAGDKDTEGELRCYTDLGYK